MKEFFPEFPDIRKIFALRAKSPNHFSQMVEKHQCLFIEVRLYAIPTGWVKANQDIVEYEFSAVYSSETPKGREVRFEEPFQTSSLVESDEEKERVGLKVFISVKERLEMMRQSLPKYVRTDIVDASGKVLDDETARHYFERTKEKHIAPF